MTDDDPIAGLSPAARSLLRTLDQDGTRIPADGPSILELRGLRQDTILEELVERGLALVSDRGHVVSSDALGRLAVWLAREKGTAAFDVPTVADEWAVSRGRCKALLSALVREGVLAKSAGVYRCA